MAEVGCLKDAHFQNLHVEGNNIITDPISGVADPSATGTSTALTVGSGLAFRRRIITLGSGDDDNVLTLTKDDSGSLIYVTPTNILGIVLPLVGNDTGIWFDIIIAANANKAFTIKTSGQDGADNISVMNQLTAATGTTTTTVDVGGTDHDILTFTNSLVGSRIEIFNAAGGAAEKWHAYIRSFSEISGTIV